MPQQVLNSVENNFTKGLLTEFTGLNFPENAATSTSNCVYTLVGDVIRRAGFDYEANFQYSIINRSDSAINTYKWNNVGGDGLTQLVVVQIGTFLLFYKSSSATVSLPLSKQPVSSFINVTSFVANGGVFDAAKECQFSDGNGYLFVYHPSCDPFYCTYTSGVIGGNKINVQVRDFNGIPETVGITTRPNVLTNEHNYNLTNQGWTSGGAWSFSSTTSTSVVHSSITFAVSSTAGVTGGDTVNIYCTDPLQFFYNPPPAGSPAMSGTVSSFVANVSITVTITYAYGGTFALGTFAKWQLTQTNQGHISTWHTAVGNYPSNADVWWYFKDTANVFNPTTTAANVTLSTSNAPQGHYILNAFNQQRGLVSGTSNITDIVTTVRPRTGCWFQGRVWYTGVDAQQPPLGDEPYYTWTESIYFSKIVQTSNDFGLCYQDNDPTSQTLFNLLPSDGGVIQIQGSGSIYKLFPLLNALLVFAANGVWYISGSAGIGFAADDYSIVKLSAVRSISSTSFVDINGLPMFWNEEGIYQVEPAKQGTSLLNSPLHVNPLEVIPLTVGTIQTFYDDIPLQSKKYVRGVYDPINYIVQWIYKSNNEVSVTDRYTYDSVLNFNNHNKAFYPYSFDITTNNPPTINGIIYVQSPGGLNTPSSVIKYVTSTFTGITFAEEKDFTYVDWASANVSNNFVSTFTTGYKLHGQAERRFQIPYVYLYSRTNGLPVAYYIQSLWDYALNPNSGRWSIQQYVNINSTNYGMIFKRHRLRGWGLVLQLKITSVDKQPFDLMGWSLYETVNQGP